MDEPDMDGRAYDAPRIPLGAALAAMPLPAPERSAWPLLATRLAQRRAPRHDRARRASLALAAGLLALALLPRGWIGLDGPASGATAAAADATAQRVQLAGLMAESARLERLVAAASDEGASSGAAAAVSVSIEDQLRTVDAQLASASGVAQQLPLWQQRVDLMRNMAAIEASRHYLASEGDSLDVALVAAY